MKRICIALIAMFRLAWAGEGFLGTRTDIVHPPSGSVIGYESILQMLVALAIVLGLIRWVMPKVIAKMNRRIVTKGQSIAIEESAAFAGGNLYIVNARGRTLLLAATANNVSCLADLTDTTKPEAEEDVFRKFLVDAEKSVSPAVPAASPDVTSALDRLGRLLPK